VAHAVVEEPPETKAESPSGRWVWPPLILILTALLVFYLGRTTGGHEGAAHAPAPESGEAEATH
jgi:hypothetical protein